jgi:hypothetical protein
MELPMRGLGLVLLAPASALLVACGTRTNVASGEQPLDDDLALAAELPTDLPSGDYPRLLASIRSCRAEGHARRVSATEVARAASLTQQAHEAELLGEQANARALLERAARLDPRNRTALYHLGRSSEALYDTAAAIRAYCRYLRLNPGEDDAAEARARVLALWQPPSTSPARALAATRAASSTPVIPTRAVPVRKPRVRQAASRAAPHPQVTVHRAEHGSTDVLQSAASNGEVTDSAVVAPIPSAPVSTAPAPSSVPPDSRRDPPRASAGGATRGAIAGAAVGAIAGAAMGGKLKHVLIGTAAGAVIGAVTGEAVSGGSN